ncbi:unnamed protein product [Soboliphyme baturini]|uniref:DUF1713 domain-containing protein n=1 Tax=Soboliphyme baturini TaxID=241478 RepID=A0A183ING8_9BILA|nr:unnamed protein product [Soboliphyme baturini]
MAMVFEHFFTIQSEMRSLASATKLRIRKKKKRRSLSSRKRVRKLWRQKMKLKQQRPCLKAFSEASARRSQLSKMIC